MNIIDDYFDNNENHIENIKYIKFTSPYKHLQYVSPKQIKNNIK